MKILIVADDSPASVKAIEFGFGMAKDLGAYTALLCVVDTALATGDVDAGIFPDDASTILKNKTADFLRRMKSEYGTPDTELMAPEGEVLKTILSTAVEWGADLIVTCTHSRTGLGRLFSGSIAESIVHHSPVPVCVVPMRK